MEIRSKMATRLAIQLETPASQQMRANRRPVLDLEAKTAKKCKPGGAFRTLATPLARKSRNMKPKGM